ncbi:hypothetical protein LINGRAHAP2_LOCUS30886 [Linum grandiflorum]
MIRSSDFISHHRSYSNGNNHRRPSIFLKRCGKEPSTEEIEKDFTLYSGPERLSSVSSVEISSPFWPVSGDPMLLRVFGSLHGLICLYDNYHIRAYIIYVWNPSLRRFVAFPTPTLTFRNMGNQIRLKMPGDPAQSRTDLKRLNDLFAVLGFGYDSRRNDYKVWPQCFVDGAIYWPATVGSKSNYILAFDVNDEMFSRIELPNELPGSGGSRRRISILETKVAGFLIVMYHTASSCEILLMKEDGWVRFCSIPRDYPYHQVVVGMWRDEKVLLEKNVEGDS